MTWLSRLLPQTNRLQASALKSRARLAKQHRRMATLETLESRVVLSNVTTSLAGNVLTITGDRFNDSFKIVETRQSDGTHVTVTSTDKTTNINGIPYNSGIYPSWTSPSAVGSIKVNLQSGASVDHDNIELYGQGVSFLETTGAVTFTATKTSLNLSVHDIDNPGAFKLTTGGPTGGALNLDMNAVRFTSISVDQKGCCPADVSITNSFSGTVSVKEGWANGDSIYLNNDTFTGNVTLSQYNGAQPAAANCDGNDDDITVLNSSVRTLTIHQDGDGLNNSATVDNVHLTPGTSTLGLLITQGNGEGDSAHVNAVVADFGVTNIRPGQELCTSIVIIQGDGEEDDASVTNSHVPGDILITQGDGATDSALVDGSSAGLPGNTLCGNIIITQGAALDTDNDLPEDLFGDTATVHNSSAVLTIQIIQNTTADSAPGGSATIDPSSAGGDVSITQGDGNNSTATITFVTSGGAISITQGMGVSNSAEISYSSSVGDTSITQNDQAGNAGDSALVDEVFSGGSINVLQGSGDGDTATVSCSTAVVDVNVTQGDGNGDTVYILGVVAGHVDFVGGVPVDVDGTVTVIQGNGYADCVIVNSCDDNDTTINNLVISQGDSLPFEGCEPGLGDCIYIDDSDITSDITITQGTGAGNTDGNYLVAIGTGEGPEGNTGPVNAGGVTTITQHGGGNTVLLGGGFGGADAGDDEEEGEYDGYDFTTVYLDVYTGEDGGAYVQAINTNVIVGSFIGNDYTIDGDGDGNTFVDLGNTVNVNANPDTFNV